MFYVVLFHFSVVVSGVFFFSNTFNGYWIHTVKMYQFLGDVIIVNIGVQYYSTEVNMALILPFQSNNHYVTYTLFNERKKTTKFLMATKVVILFQQNI